MRRYITVILFLVQMVHAQVIDVSTTPEPLLPKSQVYFAHLDDTLDIIKTKKLMAFEEAQINLAFNAKIAVWVKLTLHNPLSNPMKRVLQVDNPRLERITLFDGVHHHDAGMLYIAKDQRQINPSFTLSFDANETKTLWLRVVNKTTTLQFNLTLKSQEQFYDDDQSYQFEIMVFLGIILALLSYTFLLFFYVRDSSYLFYALYLVTLLFQQMTYVGFLPLYAPPWFTQIDNSIVVFKVAIMIIAAAWYAQYFLKTVQFKRIHRIYNGIVLFVFIQAILLGTPWFYLPEVTVLSSIVFILFNTFTGIYVYLKGNKQARFFIAGWAVLVVAYLIINLDALGVISVMSDFPGLIMWATVLEAMFLMLAFVDKISIVQHQKEVLTNELITTYAERQSVIEHEVEEKTHALSKALEEKELLFKELHHRVKNNLQLVLSLLRLQSDKAECDKQSHFLQQLDGRIRAISRTHEMLYKSDEVEIVDMSEYVEHYVDELENSFVDEYITIESSVDVSLPLQEAVYIGLVVNELVTNAIKYAYTDKRGVVYLSLHKSNDTCILEVSDEGKGYSEADVSPKSLGLRLVKTLVEEQLEGTMSVDNTRGTHYTIRFSV